MKVFLKYSDSNARSIAACYGSLGNVYGKKRAYEKAIEYYEKSLTPILLEGLKELGRKRPQNPVKFLGEFLLKNDPEN